MDYDEVTAGFFDYVETEARPEPTADASPARRLRDAFEPIAMHPVWSRSVNARTADLGLDFFGNYVWGRASALGEPEPSLVVSTFAVFEPTMISGIYDDARSKVGRAELIAARTEATTASLTEVLDGVDLASVATVADRLQAAVEAADLVGRPLFAGFTGRPWPTDPIGRLWHGCELLREHRGDSNIAVSIAHGLGPIDMNIITECWLGMPLYSYTSTRAWSPEAMEATAEGLRTSGLMVGDSLTAEGRAFRDEIERQTDDAQRSIVAALGSDLDDTITHLNTWSGLCVDAGLFPPDPFKRAAG